MERIRIGCSGWNYRHWRGLFYPKGLSEGGWFDFYAEHFDTVEINNTFYRLPTGETFAKWRAQAPAGFRYAVKANRFLTQAKKLKDCEAPLERMMAPMRQLGPALGPILYQLPSRFGINLARLEAFLQLVPKDVVNVFEFRDKSWLTTETLALLERFRVAFCVHDMPGTATERWAAGPVAYVRFHGAGGRYRGSYPHESLLGWANWIVGQARSGRPVWCYFNNDADARATRDAQTLKATVAQAAR